MSAEEGSVNVIKAVSYCRICPALCGIVVDVSDDRRVVLRVRGDPDNAASKGFTCPKGRALPQEVHAPDRLRHSWRREADGSKTSLSADHALDEIVERLTAIIDEHGPRSIGLYVGTRGYETLPLASATAWLRGIGSPMFYSTYTIDQPGKDLARALHGSWTAGFQDIASSNVVLFAGNNPLVSASSSYIGMPPSNERAELRSFRERGLKVIVIDPRRSETAANADVHLQIRPGSDAVVIGAMLHVMIAEELYDHDFVQQYAQGLDTLRSTVSVITPSMAAHLSGIDREEIIAAARLFGSGPRGCAVGGTGINMGPAPILAEYLLLCLNTVGGRYRRGGERIPNPGTLTYGRATEARVRGPREIWGKGPQPRVRGLTTIYDQMPTSAMAAEILTPGEGQIRALIVSGGNPVVALPNQPEVIEALRSLEVLVCLDVRESQTVALAHYALACKLSLEKADATVGSDLRFAKPFAQYAPAIVSPQGELVEEWEVFWGLAARMRTPWDLTARIGLPIPLNFSGDTVADSSTAKPTSWDLWNLLCSGGRVSLEELARHPHGLALEIEPQFVAESGDPGDRLDLGNSLMMEELERAASTPLDDWPFHLVSRRMWEYHNSWGQDIGTLREKIPVNPAFVHPDDLIALGVASGDRIRITSAAGSVEAEAREGPELRRGVVSMAHCWGDALGTDASTVGSNTNQLVDHAEPSLFVGIPRMSAIGVRLEAVDNGAP
jgi:anaerobic selenocysteine-containing dehydrogenase